MKQVLKPPNICAKMWEPQVNKTRRNFPASVEHFIGKQVPQYTVPPTSAGWNRSNFQLLKKSLDKPQLLTSNLAADGMQAMRYQSLYFICMCCVSLRARV